MQQEFGKNTLSRILTAAQPVEEALLPLRQQEGDWHPQLLIMLAGELLTNAKELLQGREEQNACRCAWAARNIVELYLWIRYVTQSRENARRFHEDMVCDFADMLKRSSQVPDLAAGVQEGRASWETAMQAVELIDREDKFLSVSQVAKDLGEGGVYGTVSKFLSKFVHPTSLAVQLRATPAFGMITPMIIDVGVEPFEKACAILATALTQCAASART